MEIPINNTSFFNYRGITIAILCQKKKPIMVWVSFGEEFYQMEVVTVHANKYNTGHSIYLDCDTNPVPIQAIKYDPEAKSIVVEEKFKKVSPPNNISVKDKDPDTLHFLFKLPEKKYLYYRYQISKNQHTVYLGPKCRMIETQTYSISLYPDLDQDNIVVKTARGCLHIRLLPSGKTKATWEDQPVDNMEVFPDTFHENKRKKYLTLKFL